MTNSINEEIVNTLEDVGFISNKQLEKIKDKLKDICDSDFKDFFKHYQEYYSHKKKLSYKQFVNKLIDYLIKENKYKNFKLVDEYVINEIERENKVYSFFDELTHQTTEDLQNFYSSDDGKFNVEDCECDYVIDDIKEGLNSKKIEFEDNRNNIYIKIEGFDLLSEIEYIGKGYNIDEFLNELESLIYDIDLNLQVYVRFILDNDLFKGYTDYDNKELLKLNKKITKEIKLILLKRLDVYESDLRKVKTKKYKLSSELKQMNKPLIKESINTHIEKINKHIEFIKSEIDLIKGKA